ncbi:MAG: hypothetical protein J5I47_07065 [Vicingus serpentipes]|nr:hypothetical protein [Vicingus serpentipes]
METTFEKLKVFVEPHLKNYKNDLLVHDKKTLDTYKGPFLHYTRENGTHILLMIPAEEYPDSQVSILFGVGDRVDLLLNLKDAQETFNKSGLVKAVHYYSGNGILIPVTMDIADQILYQYTRNTIDEWEEQEKIDLDIAYMKSIGEDMF